MTQKPKTPNQRRKVASPPAEAVASPPSFVYADKGNSSGAAKVIGFGSNAFAVREMDRLQAVEIVRAHHYSKKVYPSSFIHLGVYAPDLLGVLQFGPAMNPASMASVVAGTEKDEYLELNRMWLDDRLQRNSESMAISYALKYIRRQFPRIAWVQSFADERCGRYGVVYQASNFIYCGAHTSVFWELDGETYHNSLMTRKKKLPPGAKRLQDNKHRAVAHKLRQFRYIYFLKRGFRERLRHEERPYPKHASEGSMESRQASSLEGQGQILDDAPLLLVSAPASA